MPLAAFESTGAASSQGRLRRAGDGPGQAVSNREETDMPRIRFGELQSSANGDGAVAKADNAGRRRSGRIEETDPKEGRKTFG